MEIDFFQIIVKLWYFCINILQLSHYLLHIELFYGCFRCRFLPFYKIINFHFSPVLCNNFHLHNLRYGTGGFSWFCDGFVMALWWKYIQIFQNRAFLGITHKNYENATQIRIIRIVVWIMLILWKKALRTPFL